VRLPGFDGVRRKAADGGVKRVTAILTVQHQMTNSASLFFSSLGSFCAGLAPISEALLRAAVGLALVPHGLRMTFGFFPDTGQPFRNPAMLAEYLDRSGYRPGYLWAPAISFTQLVCGPMLALGLCTRLVAAPIVIFLFVSCVERWRVGGYFWNMLGLEYTLMWALAALFFLAHGGGAYSLDQLWLGQQF
jgi:putative oxidoreductase